MPFDAFKARLQPILEQKGWWGRKLVLDPKDDTHKLAQLGSPRRLRTIYWANVRTAHAAGEWQRTERNKAFLPYLVYTVSGSEHRRPEHLSWVGTVLPIDDPWWRSHYPPNGWGCKCGVRQISRREAASRGYDPEQGAPPIEPRPWRNKRTGETVEVPRGIDPGWQTNPGQTRGQMMAELMSGRLAEMPIGARPAAVADLVASPALDRFIDDAVATGAKRAEIAKELRQAGKEVAAEVLDDRAPFSFPSFPVAIAPARFGPEALPVLMDAAAIGDVAQQGMKPDRTLLAGVADALRNSQVKREGKLVRVFDEALRLFLEMEQTEATWRIRTILRTQASQLVVTG